MSKLGLHRRLTFEDVIDSGVEPDFSHIAVYNRAATNYRQGFFYQPPDNEEVADPKHDEKHEQVLAQMRAAALAMERAADAHRQQARGAFQEAMPGPRGVHEAAADPAPARPATAPARASMLASAPTTFSDRLRQRQEGFKQPENFDFRRQVNELRQQVRQRVNRQDTLDSKRRQQHFNIATPAPSPPPSPEGPSVKMQAKYDKRLLNYGQKQRPQVARPEPQSDRNTAKAGQAETCACECGTDCA